MKMTERPAAGPARSWRRPFAAVAYLVSGTFLSLSYWDFYRMLLMAQGRARGSPGNLGLARYADGAAAPAVAVAP